MTCGRPSCTRRMWPACARRASSAPMPTSTTTPASAMPPVAGARDLRIGIDQRRDHARDAGRDDGVGAGRRLAVVRARLERHVERRPARGGAGAARAPRSRRAAVRPAASSRARRSPAHPIVSHDHRTDRRIGPGAPEPAPAERQRERHEAGVIRAPRWFDVAHRVQLQLISARPIYVIPRSATRRSRNADRRTKKSSSACATAAPSISAPSGSTT